MNIEWLIPCRFVEVHDNLGTLVGAGIDTFWVPELPAALQLVCAMRITGTADELGPGVQHQTRSLVTDPSGQVVSEIAGEFNIDSSEPRTEWLNGFVLPVALLFEAPTAGTYQLEQLIDTDSRSVALHVILGTPGGAPPEAAE